MEGTPKYPNWVDFCQSDPGAEAWQGDSNQPQSVEKLGLPAWADYCQSDPDVNSWEDVEQKGYLDAPGCQ